MSDFPVNTGGPRPPQTPQGRNGQSPSASPWICIARSGTFKDSSGRDHTFTSADLERIRAGYDPAISEAPLVLGHPKDNAPAYGWVSALKTEGQKLFAQFAHVPAQIKKFVQDRAYRYVSISLAPDKTRLLHVGLLGAAAPAIDGLGPVAFEAGGLTINFALPDGAQHGGSMNPEELQRQIGELTERINALKAENESLKAKIAESDKGKTEAEAGQKTAEEAAARSAAEFSAFKGKIEGDKRAARVRALVDSGKLEPGKEAETVSFAAALALVTAPVNFAAPDGSGGGKTEQISAEERYFRELEARAADPRFTTNFSTPMPGHATDGKATAYPDITGKL